MKPALALALALLAISGCSRLTDLLPSSSSDGAAGCAQSIQLGNQAPCAGALAAKLLRYSLCSCSALLLEHGLFTEGGPPGPQPGSAPASVGTDRYLQVAGLVQVAGSLTAAGLSPGVSFSRNSAVLGNLSSGGPVAANQVLSIGTDAFIGGDVLGRVEVGDTLYVPMSANIAPSVSATTVVREPISVELPCNCGAAPPFDLPALVTAHASINDNDAIGLRPDALAKGNGPLQIDLPCGEYYLSAIDEPEDVELELLVHGRAALFVAGDVSLGRGLRVTLDDQAELDLVVMGDLTVASGMVGALDTGSVRLWLASTTVKVGSGASLSAAVYAPGAMLLSDDDLNVKGALFVSGLSIQGDLSIHFDPAISSAGMSCGVPPQPPAQ